MISCVEQQDESYLSVTAFNFIPGPYESIVVSFGKNQNDFHAFAIKKKDIKQGVEFVSNSKNNTVFSVFGDIEGEALVRSSQIETFAKVKVLSVDKQNQRAVFLVEANLLNINTNELNKLDTTKVIVKGEPFFKLMYPFD
jgi:ribosomal protein S11